MKEMVHYAAQQEGMLIAFEAAATIAAYHTLLATHFLAPEDETVLFFTGYVRDRKIFILSVL